MNILEQDAIHFSIVIPLYNSSKYLNDIQSKISEVMSSISQNCEVILVNDCSPDDSANLLQQLSNSDNRFKVINLSSNQGQAEALRTGFRHSKGEFIGVIDADLEEDPMLLVSFLADVKKENLDMLYGVTKKRQGGFVKKLGGSFFYWLIEKMTNVEFERNSVWLRVMSRSYINKCLSFPEVNIWWGGIFHLSGGNKKSRIIEKNTVIETSTSIGKRIDLAFDAITSFTSYPLKFIFYVGLAMMFLSALLILIILFVKIILDVNFRAGWPSIAIILIFFFGCVMSSLGLIGIYLGKLYIEAKNRPVCED